MLLHVLEYALTILRLVDQPSHHFLPPHVLNYDVETEILVIAANIAVCNVFEKLFYYVGVLVITRILKYLEKLIKLYLAAAILVNLINNLLYLLSGVSKAQSNEWLFKLIYTN